MTDDYLLYDVLRVVTGGLCLWLILLVARLAWRVRETSRPAPLMYASYLLALVGLGVLLIEKMSQRPTWDFWLTVVVVALGVAGCVASLRVPFGRGR